MHPHITKNARLEMSKRAVAIRKQPPLPTCPPSTPSIPSLFAKTAKEEIQQPAVAIAAVTSNHTSTRSSPKFESSHPELESFRRFLRELDGRRKQESEVQQITTDLNKMLRFCRPEGKKLVWTDLLNHNRIRQYIDLLQSRGACGLSGQLTKLDQLIHGLRYLRCDHMEERATRCKSAIRPAAAASEEQRR